MTRILGHFQNQFVGYFALGVACLGAMGTSYAAAAPVSGAVSHALSAGTAAAAKAPAGQVYEARRNAAVTSAGAGSTVTLANLPAGSYAVTAKATVTGKGGVSINVRCALTAGSSRDDAPDNVTAGLSHTVVDQLVVTFATTGSASFTCSSDASSPNAGSTGNVAPDVSNVTVVATSATSTSSSTS